MKVAIIGAGLAGLSCAIMLEEYGISPVIYEDLDFIGDREEHITASLEVMERPIRDISRYFRKNFNITFTPTQNIRKITHKSPGKTAVVKGRYLGFFMKRGKGPDTIKPQLRSQLKNTRIILGQKPDCNQLSQEYDYVVVASGRPDIPQQYGIWTDWINGWIIGATVRGRFNKNEVLMWINREYCKNGFAYLCPYDGTKAALILFAPFTTPEQMDYYWKRFFEIEKFQYTVEETFKIEHFSGTVSKYTINNIYFAGTTAGGTSPFLGFGSFNCIYMGAMSAKSIVEGLDYEKLLKTVIRKEKYFWQMRIAFDKLGNKGYDRLIGILKIPFVKFFSYHTRFNVVKLLGKILTVTNKIFK